MFAAHAMLLGQASTPNYTQSLLHFDGSDGSTTIVDEKGITWTASGGGLALATAQSKFGSASLLVPANNKMTYSSDPVFEKANKAVFTAECWFYAPSGVYSTIMASRITAGAIGTVAMTSTPGLQIEVKIANAGRTVDNTTNAGSFSANTWTHIAVVGDGTNITTYLNGSQINQQTHPNWTADSQTALQVFGTAQYTAGPNYVDEFRYSNTVRYTGTFTPPASPFNPIG